MEAKSPLKIFTIGVYGYTEDEFFGALVENEIDLFIDIRARRGVRGARYKFVNSSYLQLKLKEMGIGYAHLKELAPPDEIRIEQKRADQQKGTKKRDRAGLSMGFAEAYRKQVLQSYDMQGLFSCARRRSEYPTDKCLRRPVLFCVEQRPQACHRFLVTEALARQVDAEIEHIEKEI